LKLPNNRFSFIVPCYNEANRFDLLRNAFEDFDKIWTKDFDLILVDDGSSDATFELMNSWKESGTLKHGQIDCIRLVENRGKGHALQTGVLHANGDWMLTLDADMATKPHQLLAWLQSGLSLEKDTVYIGSRVHQESKIDAKWIRKITGGIYNLVTRIFTPIREYDTQCGFKLYPAQLGQRVFSQLRTPGWAHDIEVLSRAVKEGGKIKSLPVVWVHRDGAKIDVLQDGLRMFLETVQIGRMIQKEYKS
jgi:dolichyl-phosphate beta-glucosyltransferase